MKSRLLIFAVAAAIALAVGLSLALREQAPAEPTAAFVLPAAETLPSFELIDQNGQAFGPEQFQGQWDLVFFGFTHCPDICPTTLQTLAAARQQLIDDNAAVVPRIVLVSVDPERDTPELMGQYVDYFGDDNLGITGELEQIRQLAKSLYVYFDKVPLDNGDYTVDHSPAVLMIDADGRYHAGFAGIQSSDVYARDVALITGQR